MVDLFGAEVPPHKPHGILTVRPPKTPICSIIFGVFQLEQDSTNRKDGVCLTLLVTFKVPLEEAPIIGKCVWHETSKELGDKLLARITSKNGTIPINVIR